MAFAYRIAGWAANFENSRTRDLKTMAWVPLPNKHDGDGYTELLDHPNGAAHFGTWCALVQVASKCNPRGTLVRDGRNGEQRAHDADSLSRIVRIPAATISETIERLEEIGWLTRISLNAKDEAESPQDVATPTPQDAVTAPLIATAPPLACTRERARENGRERNGPELNNTEQSGTGGKIRPFPSDRKEPEAEPEFGLYLAALVKHYPRHHAVDVPPVQRALFEMARALPPLAEFEEALAAWGSSESWLESGGKFVPKPERFIRDERWKSRPPRSAPKSTAAIAVETDEATLAEYEAIR